MPRTKREFKILCTLPEGTWQIIQHREGGLLLVNRDHAAKTIDLKTGKVTDLVGAENGTQDSEQ
jgi:hypothetical protein